MARALKNKWIVSSKPKSDNADLAEQVLINRGLSKTEIEHFLHPDYSNDLANPLLLPDMKKAIDRIIVAINKNHKIVIYGDYDIDGITASALLHDFLLQAGAKKVEVYIPDRFEEGYGLNSDAITSLYKAGADLVISVDCGVTAVEQASLANKLGLDLIITDHHEPPEILPTGMVALVNPKLKGCKYPFTELAGVGVAFAVVRAIMQSNPEILKIGQEKWLLDLVALGTVCDVVPLLGENRILASYGLKVLKKTKRPGLKALSKVSGVEINEVDESDLGFRFGPRLNAAGRLEHAKTALNLLLSDSHKHAEEMAQKLNELNIERQAQTQDIFSSADAMAKNHLQDLILVMASSEWSHGVVGIVASRIAEKWHKPTILLQILGEDCKGSARSFGGFSIIEGLRSCDDVLTQYGGHDFAAGMKLRSDNIDLFRHTLNQYALKHIDIESMMQTVKVDVQLDDEHLELQRISDLQELQPYGSENSQPVFSSTVELYEYRKIGQHLNHVKFRFKTASQKFVDGIAFSSAHKWTDIEVGQVYEVAYHLQANVWQDTTRLQLEVIDLRLPLKNK
jgi:single-stranded-DNA-specific exonuclease